MRSQPNARLGFAGRVCLVERVLRDHWPVARAAAAFGVSARTAWKWIRRARTDGLVGLADRSTRPQHSPRRAAPALERQIARLRAERRSGPQIADRLGLPLSTVGDILRRLGLGRLPPLVPRPAIVRYERAHPGELLHIDTKKLGRITVVGHLISGNRAVRGSRGRTGWEYLHVAVDDASRVASAERLPDETAASEVVASAAARETSFLGSLYSASGKAYSADVAKVLTELGLQPAEERRARAKILTGITAAAGCTSGGSVGSDRAPLGTPLSPDYMLRIRQPLSELRAAPRTVLPAYV